MQPNSATHTAPGAVDVAPEASGGMARGLLAGLLPVALLLVIVALSVVAAIGARLIASVQDFDTQQTTTVSVVGVGLVIAFVVYAIGCVRALRHAGAWQRASGGRALGAGHRRADRRTAADPGGDHPAASLAAAAVEGEGRYGLSD